MVLGVALGIAELPYRCENSTLRSVKARLNMVAVVVLGPAGAGVRAGVSLAFGKSIFEVVLLQVVRPAVEAVVPSGGNASCCCVLAMLRVSLMSN